VTDLSQKYINMLHGSVNNDFYNALQLNMLLIILRSNLEDRRIRMKKLQAIIRKANLVHRASDAFDELADVVSPGRDNPVHEVIHELDEQAQEAAKKGQELVDTAKAASIFHDLASGTANARTDELALQVLESRLRAVGNKTVKNATKFYQNGKDLVAAGTRFFEGASHSSANPNPGAAAVPNPAPNRPAPAAAVDLRSTLDKSGVINYRPANLRAQAISRDATWGPQKGAGGRGS